VLGGLAVVAVLAILAYGLLSWFVYDQVGNAPRACWPNDRTNTPTAWTVPGGWDPDLPAMYPLPEPREVRFESRDPGMAGKDLAAWWIPASAATAADAPAVVLVHGIQSCRREANALLAAGMLHKAGFSVFLMDLRDHGDSEGDDARFAAGSEEYLDVLGGWDWVHTQGVPGDRIGLLGLSFGSVTALIAGGEDAQVAAVWADSAPPRTDEAIGLFVADQLHDGTGLSKALVPGALVWARLLAGDDLTEFNPIDEVAKVGGRHVAFVHGAADAFLPATFAIELHDRAAAAGAITPDAWLVPKAGHTQGVFADPAGYERRLVAFFTAALGEP
jgi:dipeptidyl aminopeptidase/acylaminoacyl peptidase